MKVYLSLFSFFILFLLLSLRCGQVKSPIGPHNPEFRYPLKINNQWEYARTFTQLNFRSDSQVFDSIHTITYTDIIRLTRKEILRDSIETFVLKETLTGANQTTQSELFYSNEKDGLYFHAYRGPGYIIPKVAKQSKLCFKNLYFNSIQEITSYITDSITANRMVMDSLIHEIPPLLSLIYPPELGAQWTYRPHGNPWRIDKKIIGLEEVEVPSGIYLCYKIQWLYDFNHDGKWDEDIVFYDSISEVGLLKRSITIYNVYVVSDPGSPQLLFFDVTDESVLINFSI